MFLMIPRIQPPNAMEFYPTQKAKSRCFYWRPPPVKRFKLKSVRAEFPCVIRANLRYNVWAKATPTMKNVLAIYPGSFDPVTNGHLDLIQRGAKIFERLIVSILRNFDKEPLFTLDERVEMLREVTQPCPNVEIDVFSGLLVDYAQLRGAQVILRGIRAISDYEYELQMAMMNRKLEPNVETVFMMPAEAYSYVSSRLVREITQLGRHVTGLVPPVVEQRLRAKFSKFQGA
jgi:pantetheine-phosphate adenylyltransferase